MPHYTLPNGETIQVDEDTLARMDGYTWNRRKNGAVTAVYRNKETKKTAELSLHKLILGEATPGMVRVHADADNCNFLRTNITEVPKGRHSPAISGLSDEDRRRLAIERSTKKYVGVSTNGSRFTAAISVKGRQKHIGTFDDEKAAARAYDRELDKLGYAPVNFPESA